MFLLQLVMSVTLFLKKIQAASDRSMNVYEKLLSHVKHTLGGIDIPYHEATATRAFAFRIVVRTINHSAIAVDKSSGNIPRRY